MKPAVYTYSNPEKQTVHFRGYVKEYQGMKIITHSCKIVRKNKLKAMDDAKKLIVKMKKSCIKNLETLKK